MRRASWVDGQLLMEHYDPSGDAEINAEAAQQFAAALAERLSEICDEAADRIDVLRVAAPVQHDSAVCGLTSICFVKALVEAHVAKKGRAKAGEGVSSLGWGEVEVLRRAAAAAMQPAKM